MAPLVEDGAQYVIYSPAVLLFCVIILMVLWLINCAEEDRGQNEHAPATSHVKNSSTEHRVTREDARYVRGNPAAPVIPSRNERPPLASDSSEESNAIVKSHYMNQQIPINDTSSEHYVNTYMNAAAAGTAIESLNFDATKVLKSLKASMDKYRIAENRLELHDVIGKGTFGLVYRGSMKNTKPPGSKEVAVKTIHGEVCTETDMKNFLEEILRMAGFNHVNVQNTIGVCFRSNRPYAIMPFMHYGDLRAFLLGKERVFTMRDLLHFAQQVAKGMAYLSSLKFVHRDLAARNCMIDETKTVKVADFGLSRDIFESDYYRMHSESTTPLPVRWMAPESLTTQVFTTKSDVWSYGIVLWEIITRGMTPYYSMTSPKTVLYVAKGGRLSKPANCPSFIYNNIMTQCWDVNPSKRTDFPNIVQIQRSILNQPAVKQD